MDFARKQLEKYGWSEGKGLGRNENGIAAPLKPKLKFDNAGVGHKAGDQFTNNWWENLFNNAADNLNVVVDEQEVKMNVKSDDAFEITTKRYSVKKLKDRKDVQYGFLKTSQLTEEGTVDLGTEPVEVQTKRFQALTDEELFAACGGRTAHKGARHGLKLNGKLSRIDKQEKILLKKLKKVSLSDEYSKHEKKLKKLMKQKEDKLNTDYNPETEPGVSMKKKKHKKKKSVTFNENVQCITLELDTSVESEANSYKDENSNEPCLDEGIEKDMENNNNETEDNHRSFEEAQLNINDLSKAERKKLKKKRKLEVKLNSSTNKFLESLKDDSEAVVDLDKNKKKRKFYLEEIDGGRCTPFVIEEKSKKNKKKKKNRSEEGQSSCMDSLETDMTFCRISDNE